LVAPGEPMMEDCHDLLEEQIQALVSRCESLGMTMIVALSSYDVKDGKDSVTYECTGSYISVLGLVTDIQNQLTFGARNG
jgi:hypothetical protein